MRVVIIGGTGHVGTYLVPRLISLGYEVISISRQKRQPYQPHHAWNGVQQITIDREVSEQSGQFGAQIRELEPDIVIDMICFTLKSAQHLAESLHGQIQHFLHCGTIWVHGPSERVPISENQPRKPFGQYGIQKAEIETYLLKQARQYGFPATLLHPGHIVGPGWAPLNPAGNFNLQVFKNLARGEELLLPNLGMETVHHVHADDVAQAFIRALDNRSCALGESFHIVSPQALTLRGYAQEMASWFGQPARISYLPWEEWRTTVSEIDAQATWDHIAHSPCCSIAKAQRLLEYAPRYTSLQAVQESIQWLMNNNCLEA